MKSFFVSVLLIFSISNSFNYSQSIPNYQERSFKILNDSLKVSGYSEDATEGAIDADLYFVGPGDKFLISISGLEEIQHIIQVNPEGNFYVPRLGGINLSGKTLTDSKEQITESLNKIYKNVDIFVSLLEFRKIKVSLVGDVKKPATFIFKSNSRLLDLIASSDGLNSTADYRNIISKIKRQC